MWLAARKDVPLKGKSRAVSGVAKAKQAN